MYRLMMHKKLNLLDPSTFNEKMQWLKIYDKNPFYTDLVDKYEVRNFIERAIGKEYLVPIFGVYDNAEDIDFSLLPKKFILKPTHTSGDLIICEDKTDLDIKATRRTLDNWLKQEYFWNLREWPYKYIKPRIVCEKFLVDESGYELKDYKIWCFDGVPKLIQVMSGRKDGQYYLNHFDLHWNPLDIKRISHAEVDPSKIIRPSRLDEMIWIAKTLSHDIPFVRVDLYHTLDRVYFGELTFYPGSGFLDFANIEDNILLGSWLDLSLVKHSNVD